MQTWFPDWYQMVSLRPDSDAIPKRWAGVELLTKDINSDAVLNLTRLASKRRLKDEAFRDSFCGRFRETDPAFLTRENDEEISLLAAAALGALLASSTRQADIAALSVLCVTRLGSAGTRLLSELEDLSRKYLHQEGQRVRIIESIPDLPKASQTWAASLQEIAKHVESPGSPEFAQSVKAHLNELHTTVRAILSATRESIHDLRSNQSILQEEVNIAWWLIGEYSRDLDRPFADLTVATLCSLIPKELADLTEETPGPVSASAVIYRALRSGRAELPESVTLREVVAESSKPWLHSWLSRESVLRVSDICSGLTALALAAEAEGDEWVQNFSRLTGDDPDLASSPVQMAVRLYNEHMLLAALR